MMQVLAWCAGNSLHPCYHPHKSRKRRLAWALKSPPEYKAAWAHIAHPKFSIARPEFILIDITELTLN